MGLPAKFLTDAALKAYWKFEADNFLGESSGKGYTLTNNNSVAQNNAGKYGGCADGGATNTNKYLVSSAMAKIGNTRSYAFWIKLNTETSGTTYQFLRGWDGTNLLDFMVFYEYNSGTRRMRFTVDRYNVSASTIYSNIALGTSDWHLIVIDYNGSTMGLTVDNGTRVTGSASGKGSGSQSNDKLMLLGDGSFFAPALIDEVLEFNKVLSAAERTEIYIGESKFFQMF